MLGMATRVSAGQEKQPPHFEQDILPILSRHCLQCHGAQSPQQGLDLSTAASLRKGSKNGPVVMEGFSEKSLLFQRVSSRSMPPEAMADPLSDKEIETIRKWIDEGDLSQQAEAASQEVIAEAEEPEISEKERQFWAFRSPVRAGVPQVKNRKRVQTPIDAFVLSKLEAKGLTFSPEASRLTLVRRAYFDLIGLPPSPEEVKAFLKDSRPDAYQRLIDRLLASPHYGERWGRHWLDVAGYTDMAGLDAGQEYLRFNEGIWRYRDYVVRSFNEDKPYDRFLTEQLAGDELVEWRDAPKFTRKILDPLIATGFLRLVIDTTHEDVSNHPEKYYEVLDQIIRMVSSSLLGLTMGCARCHNHKYDPIYQQDYYKMMAVFTSGYNPEKWLQPKDRSLPDISKADQEEIKQHNEKIDPPLETLKEKLADLHRPYEKKLFEEKLKGVAEPLREETRTAFETPEEKRDQIQKFLFGKLKKILEVTPQEVGRALNETDQAVTAQLDGQIEELGSQRRSFGKIPALWDVGPQPMIRVHQRGNWQTPGGRVEPGFLAVLSAPGQSRTRKPPQTAGDSSGHRLALARWLTSREHPLTARVMVNRIWQHHFGKGIVASSENFGNQGTRPTHPELLDWLAVDFVEKGWRIKRLHKLIMTSTVYRQSSLRPEEGTQSVAESVDPANDLLWRMNLRRMEAESVRDSILAVSGKLDLTMGGEPVPLEVTPDGLQTVLKGSTTLMIITAEGLQTVEVSEDDLGSRYRRSIYLLARRNYPLTFLEVFDSPIMAINCARRTHAATSLQSLQLLNSEFAMEQADYFAARVRSLAGENAPLRDKIHTAYELALAREPTAGEGKFCQLHLEQQAQLYRDQDFSNEEASQRALASLCQMLICSSEFLYVD